MTDTPAAPLDGITVVDFSRLIAGPCATDLLASLGARVIKVEGHEGDPMRLTRSKEAGGGPTAPTFAAFNVMKETIALDLKNAGDLAFAKRLCREADVVVEAFRPGVMDRLGLGADALRAENPGLVYAGLSAFGATGPEQARGGVDIVLQAETGLMSVTGDAGQEPTKAGVPIIDAASGAMLTVGILAALVGRGKTGQGDTVRTSMLDVGIFLQAQQYAEFLASGIVPPRVGNKAAYAAPADVFPVSDGQIVLSAHIVPHWKKLCAILGHEEWIEDPAFVTVKERVENRETLNARIAEVLTRNSAAFWLAQFNAVGITAGQVKDYREVIATPQVDANGSVVDAVNVDGSPLRIIRPPLRFGHFDDRSLPRRVRGIDESGAELRSEFAGELAQ
ncbi:CoA transferase [Salipiger sp. P9]|uniref:CaiB/BaiF CoA transferase family protein n=1 Tax=Salipiger pentaromativorans TaxID=2943193 RepID=UPI002157C3CA|nr:CoA transferase [Salipiger pentaromativorans]MCR8549177.1 CoA transferase [Salipiger pentaromativorans]